MQTGSKSTGHMVDFLFTIALFCVFAASALMVVLIGANVYKKTAKQMEHNFSTRTSMAYVATKVRQNDVADAMILTTLQGVPALLLRQEIEGAYFDTWIYHFDGALREIFTPSGNDIALEDGQHIVDVDSLRIEGTDGSLLLTSFDLDGYEVSYRITPRCGIQLGQGANNEK